ncbi:hypothetical protein ACWZEH_17895 [Streptomyces sp. QTS137]
MARAVRAGAQQYLAALFPGRTTAQVTVTVTGLVRPVHPHRPGRGRPGHM